MVSSLGSTAEDSVQLMMAQISQKLNATDKKGVNGLSKEDLSSIMTGSDQLSGSAFIKSLSDQFDQLDADKNGELSVNEISSAVAQMGPMGIPPGMSIESSEDAESGTLTGAASKVTSGKVEESVTGSESTDSTDSAKDLMDKILKSFLESFSDTFSKDNKGKSDEDAQKVKSLVGAADKDGNGSLSLDELSSVDTSQNPQQASFVKDLIKNFDTYDKNADGQLSIDEMKAAIPKKPFSLQELSAMSDLSSKSEELANSLGSISGAFARNALSSYQNGGLSNLKSTLSMVS